MYNFSEITFSNNWQKIPHRWPDSDNEFFYVVQNEQTDNGIGKKYSWELNLTNLLENEYRFAQSYLNFSLKVTSFKFLNL